MDQKQQLKPWWELVESQNVLEPQVVAESQNLVGDYTPLEELDGDEENLVIDESSLIAMEPGYYMERARLSTTASSTSLFQNMKHEQSKIASSEIQELHAVKEEVDSEAETLFYEPIDDMEGVCGVDGNEENVTIEPGFYMLSGPLSPSPSRPLSPTSSNGDLGEDAPANHAVEEEEERDPNILTFFNVPISYWEIEKLFGLPLEDFVDMNPQELAHLFMARLQRCNARRTVATQTDDSAESCKKCERCKRRRQRHRNRYRDCNHQRHCHRHCCRKRHRHHRHQHCHRHRLCQRHHH